MTFEQLFTEGRPPCIEYTYLLNDYKDQVVLNIGKLVEIDEIIQPRAYNQSILFTQASVESCLSQLCREEEITRSIETIFQTEIDCL